MSAPREDAPVAGAPAERQFTLAFVFADATKHEVLLGRKKKGFGEGLLNGFGGKVEPGESPLEAARRELEEESGVSAELRKRGNLHFSFNEAKVLYKGKPATPMHVHVYEAVGYTGEPQETDEMQPQWFKADPKTLPFDEMWPDDVYWLPFLITNPSNFDGFFDFDDETTIVKSRLVTDDPDTPEIVCTPAAAAAPTAPAVSSEAGR